MSLNLPINDQLVGALASRTTHPKFIRLFNAFIATVLSQKVVVRNPLWNKTRPEALQALKESGDQNLLQETVSCSRTRGRPRVQPHCGFCFQCVDRRFGTLAAGLEEHDLSERYGIDIFTQELPEGEARTVATSYVRFAQTVEGLDEARFFDEFPQLYDCIDSAGRTDEEAASLVAMLGRHALSVLRVLESQLAANLGAIVRNELPPHSLLRLVSIGQGVPGAADTGGDVFQPSPDYRTVKLREVAFYLTPNQAAAVRLLHKAHLGRVPELSGSYILEGIEAGARSMSDLFKGAEAWGRLVVHGSSRGMYRLNL